MSQNLKHPPVNITTMNTSTAVNGPRPTIHYGQNRIFDPSAYRASVEVQSNPQQHTTVPPQRNDAFIRSDSEPLEGGNDDSDSDDHEIFLNDNISFKDKMLDLNGAINRGRLAKAAQEAWNHDNFELECDQCAEYGSECTHAEDAARCEPCKNDTRRRCSRLRSFLRHYVAATSSLDGPFFDSHYDTYRGELEDMGYGGHAPGRARKNAGNKTAGKQKDGSRKPRAICGGRRKKRTNDDDRTLSLKTAKRIERKSNRGLSVKAPIAANRHKTTGDSSMGQCQQREDIYELSNERSTRFSHNDSDAGTHRQHESVFDRLPSIILYQKIIQNELAALEGGVNDTLRNAVNKVHKDLESLVQDEFKLRLTQRPSGEFSRFKAPRIPEAVERRGANRKRLRCDSESDEDENYEDNPASGSTSQKCRNTVNFQVGRRSG